MPNQRTKLTGIRCRIMDKKAELSLLVGDVIYRAIGGSAHRTLYNICRDAIPTKWTKDNYNRLVWAARYSGITV